MPKHGRTIEYLVPCVRTGGTNMKAFLFTSAVALALAGAVGTASAADLARRPPPPPPPRAPVVAPSYNWTGLYVGINGGYGFGRSKWDGLPASFDVNGGMVGGQIGYNVQSSQFVYGLEGDGDSTGLRGPSSVALRPSVSCNTTHASPSPARGRLAFAPDTVPPEVTGY